MSLPIFQTQDQILSMLQTRWASFINPLLASPLKSPYILTSIDLVSGNNIINHLQEKELTGYIIIKMVGSYADIYEVPSTMPKKTLILNASAPTTIDLMVF